MTSAAVAERVSKVPRRVVEDHGNPLLGMLGQLATSTNFNAEAFKMVVDLVREEKAASAKAEFNAAFSAMQAELPPAPKKGRGHNQKPYARYEDIDAVAKPVLAKHGLSINHSIHQDEAKIRIRAVLRHMAGHEESTEIVLPLDTSGSKNNVQAHGSTTQYGRRYTYAALIGMSTEEDDDGQAAGGVVSTEQRDAIVKAIEFSGADEGRFKKFFKVDDIANLPAKEFDRAMKMLAQKVGS